jgi:hypothetical protein
MMFPAPSVHCYLLKYAEICPEITYEHMVLGIFSVLKELIKSRRSQIFMIAHSCCSWKIYITAKYIVCDMTRTDRLANQCFQFQVY